MRRSTLILLILVQAAAQTDRPRARDLGLAPGVFPPGPLNAITDVAGCEVGHVTLIEGDNVRTASRRSCRTPAICFRRRCRARCSWATRSASWPGSTQVDELGTIETPVDTDEHAERRAPGWRARSRTRWGSRATSGGIGQRAGGRDQRRRTERHPRDACAGASTCWRRSARRRTAPVAEGSVGAGTGTQCYGWKGGIGTSSRKAGQRYGGYTRRGPGADEFRRHADDGRGSGGAGARASTPYANAGAGRRVVHDRGGDGCPADARDLKRLAARAVFGLGADRVVLQQRQRRFRDRIFDRRRGADPAGRLVPAEYEALPARCRVAAVRDGAGGHRGGGVQLAAAGDDGGIQAGEGGGNPGGAGARDPEEVRRGEVAATPARCRGDTRPGTPRCRA